MEHWHFRKEVTLGTILTLIVYGLTLVVLVVKMDGRLTALEAVTVTPERMAIIETRVLAGERNLDRLEQRTLRSLDDIYRILTRIEERQQRAAPSSGDANSR